MATLSTGFTQKSPIKFECIPCTFKCSNKKDYNRHILTAKHEKSTKSTDFTQKTPYVFICEKCNKNYKDRSGLWRHNNKCNTDNQK